MHSGPRSNQEFPATRWTLVALAGDQSAGSEREMAMEELCTAYWPPIYAFLRSKGNSPEEAEDLVQGFFADFLSREHFSGAKPERGKLRTYLLRSVSNFASRMHRDASRQKRGGNQKVLSLNLSDEQGRPVFPEPTDGVTPESAFHRQWALTLLEQVIENLRAEYRERGKEATFEALLFCVSTHLEARPYAEVAKELGASEGSVKVAAHRLRERYQKALRQSIADTLLPGEEIDEEIRELMSAFD